MAWVQRKDLVPVALPFNELEEKMMFRFFERGRPKEPDGSVIAFDLGPFYDSLTVRQKADFKPLADTLHTEIHKMATVFSFAYLMACCIRKQKNGLLGLADPIEASLLLDDKDYARRNLEIYFPINQLESAKILCRFVPNNSPPNSVLSVISGEAAIRALRREFYSH